MAKIVKIAYIITRASEKDFDFIPDIFENNKVEKYDSVIHMTLQKPIEYYETYPGCPDFSKLDRDVGRVNDNFVEMLNEVFDKRRVSFFFIKDTDLPPVN